MKYIVLFLASCLLLEANFPNKMGTITISDLTTPTPSTWIDFDLSQYHFVKNMGANAQVATMIESLKQELNAICYDSITPSIWLNFSPYTKTGQNPNDTSVVIPEIQIIALLDSIKAQLPCVVGIRTFGTQHGLENIPRLAKERGFKVVVGIWIDREPVALATNKAQIANGIKIVKDGYADAVIVGSEVLLRGNWSDAPTKLIQYINEIKVVCTPLQIPVSCADVYYELAAFPNVVAACDFVAPNIYPFWEGTPIDEAMQRFHHAYQIVLAAAKGKPIFISESGWKTSGKNQGNAIASLSNALKYNRSLLHWSKATGVEVCIFEAFDEPWKLPNDDGWGVFFNDGKLKPDMDSLCAPIINIDTTWLCDKLGGNGQPTIAFDYVPIIGSSEQVRGHVNFVAPCDYMVALYIKVGSGWWTKPYFIPPFVPINADGTWSSPYLTGGSDGSATEICAFLIPTNYWPPKAMGNQSLPATIYQNSIAYTCYQRYVLSPVSASAALDTICLGDTAMLTATGGKHYLWSTNDTTASIKVAPKYNGKNTYRVTITDGMGGGATAIAYVQVISPSVAISKNPTSICQGETATLKASGGVIYLWSTGETTDSIKVSPDTTTLYTVTVTDAKGCTTKASTQLYVNTFSFIIQSNNSKSCVGKTMTLFPSYSGKAYQWSTGQTTHSIQVTPMDTLPHIYSLTITNNAGCANSNTIILKASTIPVVTLMASSNKICQGDSTRITATPGIGTYRWNTGDTTSTIWVAPPSSKTYGVTVTNAAGCTAYKSITISVLSIPFVTISASPSSVCSGKQSTVTATGGGTYLWNTGQTTASILVYPTETTTYTVTVTNSLNCSKTDFITVIVSTLDTFNVIGGGSYCLGDVGAEVALSGSQKGASYQLKIDDINVGALIPGTDSAISFGLQTTEGTYSVVATDDTTGCTNTMMGSAVIQVNQIPARFNVGGGGAYCDKNLGVEITLSGSQSEVKYQLKANGEDLNNVIGTGTAISFGKQTTSGIYTVVATNTETGCTSLMSDSTEVKIYPLPVVILTALDSVYSNQDPPQELFGFPPGGTYVGSGVADSIFFYPTKAGIGQHTIYYSFTDANGCTGIDSFVVMVIETTAEKMRQRINSFMVFPKPNQGTFWMQLEISEPMTIEISIISPMGLVLLSQWEYLPSGETMLLVEKPGLPSGLYSLLLRTQTGDFLIEKLPIN